MVIVVHTFDTSEAAHAFFANEDLKGAMTQAGVDMASFQIEFLDEVVSGTL